jgi:hypothetical protein
MYFGNVTWCPFPPARVLTDLRFEGRRLPRYVSAQQAALDADLARATDVGR